MCLKTFKGEKWTMNRIVAHFRSAQLTRERFFQPLLSQYRKQYDGRFRLANFAANQYSRICYWKYFQREIGSVVTESWFIVHQRRLVEKVCLLSLSLLRRWDRQEASLSLSLDLTTLFVSLDDRIQECGNIIWRWYNSLKILTMMSFPLFRGLLSAR